MAKAAFIGLGVMGYPMAKHLKERGGHDVTVYNRTAAKAAEWVRSRQPATLGIAVVGTAGADEGVFGKSNGESWLGLSDGRKTTTMLIPYGGQDEYTHVRIGNQVLATLRRWADERAGAA